MEGRGVVAMDGHVIVKLKADALAEREGIVKQFNEYMNLNRSEHSPSFVHDSEGYFRLSHSGGPASSAGINEFGNFLHSSGYTVTGISGKRTLDGGSGTEFSFEKGGMVARVLLCTLGF